MQIPWIPLHFGIDKVVDDRYTTYSNMYDLKQNNCGMVMGGGGDETRALEPLENEAIAGALFFRAKAPRFLN